MDETVLSRSPEETLACGERLAREPVGDAAGSGTRIVLLEGTLGSGKTLLTKGIARGLGVTDWRYVCSPTFTLINEYQGQRLPLFHFDLYRLEAAADLDELGFDEYLQRPGIVVIEWPERAALRLHDLPAIRVELVITGPEDRRITISRPA
ncbi:MAG: tRNA (adenosine(37)-N6)-threonylcarbamoyltransferase complex ATPase subunit type 1 TsaE [Deltaproteobacteria bacterium]|nr:tRNA (adenosine(37)-N6)-threonylcarbamoyltransferase complex ATPase subunit type 1 TsaE [Candidatus Anaeroferrophillacea bacterium]